ncbi:hypothetical protein LZ32DRAFT_310966 [Colletotrichum eremochloae]|nr:hypothetical protein LZ32DRAFT_310966 [Colletotrichum eremochloae]
MLHQKCPPFSLSLPLSLSLQRYCCTAMDAHSSSSVNESGLGFLGRGGACVGGNSRSTTVALNFGCAGLANQNLLTSLASRASDGGVLLARSHLPPIHVCVCVCVCVCVYVCPSLLAFFFSPFYLFFVVLSAHFFPSTGAATLDFPDAGRVAGYAVASGKRMRTWHDTLGWWGRPRPKSSDCPGMEEGDPRRAVNSHLLPTSFDDTLARFGLEEGGKIADHGSGTDSSGKRSALSLLQCCVLCTSFM